MNRIRNLGFVPSTHPWLVCESVAYTTEWDIVSIYSEYLDAHEHAHQLAAMNTGSVYAIRDNYHEAWALTVYAESASPVGAVLVTTYGDEYSEDGRLPHTEDGID